jgi:pimeloyl-ACP methyl ester carboxylesterase
MTAVAASLLTPRGGTGVPIVLVHGLMGRGSTWSRQVPWLTELGAVFTYDAPWHRGRDVVDDRPISTESLVADLGDAVAELPEPALLVGHSMGGLHAWCLAAEAPELVRALVVEDMAPDFRGRTTGPWEPWLLALPEEFPSEQAVVDIFGPIAGRYFLDAFDRTPTGWRLHGHVGTWVQIAAEWGRRDYWEQWSQVQAPTLLVEAAESVTPPGQVRRMHDTGAATTYRLVAAGHLVHDDAPDDYRRMVTDFLAPFTGRA